MRRLRVTTVSEPSEASTAPTTTREPVAERAALRQPQELARPHRAADREQGGDVLGRPVEPGTVILDNIDVVGLVDEPDRNSALDRVAKPVDRIERSDRRDSEDGTRDNGTHPFRGVPFVPVPGADPLVPTIVLWMTIFKRAPISTGPKQVQAPTKTTRF